MKKMTIKDIREMGLLGQLGQLGPLGRLGLLGRLGPLGRLGLLGRLGQLGQLGLLGRLGLLGQLGQLGTLGRLGLLGLLGPLGLMGCSADDEGREGTTVEVMPCTRQFVLVESGNFSSQNGQDSHEYQSGLNTSTRAWVPPTGYSLHDGDEPIELFFTSDGNAPEESHLYKSNDGKWRSSYNLDPTTYYLYGMMPLLPGIGASVTDPYGGNESYSDGAILTLTGLPAVTTTDIGVIVGAKNGKDDYSSSTDYTVTGLTTGDFRYEAAVTNHVYLLFDHLYAAMRFRYKVYSTYAELRTIKLKGVSVKAGDASAKAAVNVTIPLSATGNDTSPLGTITYTPAGSTAVTTPIFADATGITLQTGTPTDYIACFAPMGVTELTLTSTYDVYDRKGNLIRRDCTADNKIVLRERFNVGVASRGTMYSLTLTVNPTYLYVLSDPDLDNPTLLIED